MAHCAPKPLARGRSKGHEYTESGAGHSESQGRCSRCLWDRIQGGAGRSREPIRGDAMTDWIDISIPLKSGMVHWPGDPEVRIERVLDIERGDHCNVSSVVMGSHTGTHMDPPFHYLRDGASLDTMPFEAVIGPARVIEIEDSEAVK